MAGQSALEERFYPEPRKTTGWRTIGSLDGGKENHRSGHFPVHESLPGFAFLAELSSDAILVAGERGETVYANLKALSLLGCSKEAILGRPLGEVFLVQDPRSRTPLVTEPELGLSGMENRRVGVLSTDLRRKRTIEFQSIPLPGDLRGYLILFQDCTRRENDADRIGMLACALESIGEGVLILDPDFSAPGPIIRFTNKAMGQISGYKPSELKGQSLRTLMGERSDYTSLEELEKELHRHQAASCELVNFRRDGTEFIANWKFFPLHGPRKQPLQYVAIVEDVSQVRRLEQDLFQSQKMEAIGRLAGGIAHDFNNILAIILSFSDLLLEKIPSGDGSLHFVSEIRKAAERAAELTQQLMAFSRRKNMAPRVLDLKAAVRETQTVLHRLIPENIALDLQCTDNPSYIKINRTALEQILINLTTNARDSMSSGGKISISVRILPGSETVLCLPEYMADQEYVVLRFADTGAGIPKEHLQRIFEPFFTTKSVGKGTGLGLSTLYGIMKQANGHVEVESKVGQGTTFHLYFPKADSPNHYADSQDESSQTPVPAATQRETILVVEDDETICDCIAGLLGMYNYEVYSTNNAEDALEFFREKSGSLRLLITDLVLPGMRGSELARHLLEGHPGMKVIYMTGYSEEYLEEFEQPGEHLVLRKPFSLKSVLQTVQEVLPNPVLTG